MNLSTAAIWIVVMTHNSTEHTHASYSCIYAFRLRRNICQKGENTPRERGSRKPENRRRQPLPVVFVRRREFLAYTSTCLPHFAGRLGYVPSATNTGALERTA